MAVCRQQTQKVVAYVIVMAVVAMLSPSVWTAGTDGRMVAYVPVPVPVVPPLLPVIERPVAADRPTVVRLNKVLEVVLPAGAVTGLAPRVTARVVPTADARPLLERAAAAGLTAASSVVQLSLVGGEFAAPVRLTLSFDAARVGAGTAPQLFVYNERTRRWVYLGGQVADGRVTATVDRFSRFAVFAALPPPALFDIAGHWGSAPIRTLAGMGLVSSSADGSFDPDTGVDRAGFVVMLTHALGLEARPEAAGKFRDVAGLARGPIGAAVHAGLVAGLPDGSFRPTQRLTRAEAAVILARVLDRGLVPVISGKEVAFADAGVVPTWAREAVRLVSLAGLVRGFPDGTLRPNSWATMAEAAAILFRLVADR
ncbi:MAG: S-layer homology domain-containing protein [Bacillota bacterium]